MLFRAHRRRVRYVSPLTVAAILAREEREARERAAAAGASQPQTPNPKPQTAPV